MNISDARQTPRYMAANHPLRHTALSADGDDVAVAGTRGLALYSRRSGRWRLFGDVSQERQIEVQVRRTGAFWAYGSGVLTRASDSRGSQARSGYSCILHTVE